MAQEPHDHELATIPAELIERKIYLIRGHKVMLDRDLAELYGVSTGRLNEQVKRNRKRFPEDFMFQLTPDETAALRGSRSQNAILKRGQNIKYLPYVFTEHGVAMLASVLRSDRAAQMNILIVRAFVKLREILATHTDLARAIEAIGHRLDKHDQQIEAIIETINRLLAPEPVPPPHRIGFNAGDESETSSE
jgi:phage regulator Rha-like protein